ncbi:Hypothetical predicted protein [Mytilus galloprovincialis]|uniref:ShKT domain-containing protein n=1 Tax=Mytilus galloprovincialis TaxID=29158 RepID=A0A8B6EZR3_MYTGA|nr:Hypothetical predicted protein [Mytilus galloprovincialis]
MSFCKQIVKKRERKAPPVMTTTTISTQTSPVCNDSPFVTCSDQHVCADPTLKQLCPFSCGLCSCADSTFVTCSSSLCANDNFRQLCQKTCGVCGISLSGSTTASWIHINGK